jgi:hypothetical protein
VSDTWFKARHTNRQVSPSGFHVVRAGGGRRGDGVVLHMKENLWYKLVAWSRLLSVVANLFV